MRWPNGRAIVGLVVPALEQGGGVPAVALFLKDTILRSGRFDLRLVSLANASDDACNVNLTAPATWPRGVATTSGVWESLPYSHVGALWGEFEFQRYRPRVALTNALAECDMVQVVCGSAACANAVLGLGKPVAVQVATRARVERRLRDANPRGLSGWWRRAMTDVTDRMDDRALRRVDAIQVENPWMLEYVRKLNIGRDVDLRHAPPGVDAKLFCPPDRREPMQDAYILCVARFSDPRKNVGLLLEAYARLPENVRNQVRLLLAGSSEPSGSFWKRADVLGVRGRVTYLERPDRNTLVRLYQGASVFALPSDEEGLGVVLLEAMACGVPVIATRSGGPDGIISDGNDGYLVPLDDVTALSKRLAQLLQDHALNIEMGRKARLTVERRYDQRVAGEVFVEMWDLMMQKARAT